MANDLEITGREGTIILSSKKEFASIVVVDDCYAQECIIDREDIKKAIDFLKECLIICDGERK